MNNSVGLNKIIDERQWWPEDAWPEVDKVLENPGVSYWFDSYHGRIRLEPGDYILTVAGGHKIVFRLNKGIQRVGKL